MALSTRQLSTPFATTASWLRSLGLYVVEMAVFFPFFAAYFLLRGAAPTNVPVATDNALRIITADPNVKAILFNIFGGITRTDDVANGIVTATKQNPLKVPIVIRLTGTNEEVAMKILQENGFSASSDMDEAVKKAVELAQGGTAA